MILCMSEPLGQQLKLLGKNRVLDNQVQSLITNEETESK